MQKYKDFLNRQNILKEILTRPAIYNKALVFVNGI